MAPQKKLRLGHGSHGTDNRGATWASLGRCEWGLSRNPGVDHPPQGSWIMLEWGEHAWIHLWCMVFYDYGIPSVVVFSPHSNGISTWTDGIIHASSRVQVVLPVWIMKRWRTLVKKGKKGDGTWIYMDLPKLIGKYWNLVDLESCNFN